MADDVSEKPVKQDASSTALSVFIHHCFRRLILFIAGLIISSHARSGKQVSA